jgi:CheY-like chemotaxis protein
LKEFPQEYEGPFLKEERDLLENLAALLSGTVSRQALRELLYNNTERLKELRGINQTSKILKESKSTDEALQVICSILPEAYQFPEHTAARITYGNRVFTSHNFRESPWLQKQPFEISEGLEGLIEVFYLREFPDADEGPFLQEERNLLINLAHLIAGSATRDIFNKLLYENRERLKELHVINHTSHIISQGRPIDETLQKVCSVIPRSWQFPRYTAVRIVYEGKTWVSRKFQNTPWVMQETFVTFDNKRGSIEVYYLKEFPLSYEGPFLREERQLIINLGKLISGYLNSYKGREIYSKSKYEKLETLNPGEYRQTLVKNKRPLQLVFNQQSLDKYIYLDMMKYKVKEILFVATLYDAFILENEDSFFEQFMGIIYQYSLFSLPRITGVTTPEEALDLLDTVNFDMAILMVGMDKDTPVRLCDQLKEKRPSLPIYLLLNQKGNIKYFEELVPALTSVNKLFVWSGNSQIFFAIVKSIEDAANVENDTRIGLVRIILLVEDSALYYSKYLQMLYAIVFGQVQQVLPEVEKNELDKICKMRSRPKIILARNYEDAMFIFNKYKDFMLCVISDVEFECDGKLDKTAGIRFINYIKSHILNLPIILQSSEKSNKQLAKNLNVSFINKNSDTLLNDLKNFLTYYLGFGDFVFRNREGKPIAVAKSLREFEALLHTIPDETFYLHAQENQFSLWLMARGEIELARTLNPMRIGDYKDVKQSRQFFLDTFTKYREEKKKGKVLSFDETAIMDERNIVAFASGSFGGKGRGLAFINALVHNFDFGGVTQKINIRTPITAIIGTEEFENFIEMNGLFELIIRPEVTYAEIRKAFANGRLSSALIKKLEFFVEQIEKPIAVRSSSLSEDSLTQPFAGVFDTYIIPNNRHQKQNVLVNLMQAVKMVFASVYSDNSKTYFQAIHHKVEEEKMAVVLQELVGNQYDNYYYPHISGIAQSYNYYPVAHMQPDEGFAVAAIGLGSYVVEGWKSYRFSPRYPKIEMYSLKDLLNSSQLKFYALNIQRHEVDYVADGELASLELLDIGDAEKHGALNHCASVYVADNDRMEPGLSGAGPRVINFADILRFHYIPLAETIDIMLGTIEDALGSPVELEYAVDLNPTKNNLPSFYLLQIKPLVGNQLGYNIDLDKIDPNQVLLYTQSGLGNGELIHIHDFIFVDTDKFDKMRTYEIAAEVEKLNAGMISTNKEYILIGPGRWGTRDRFLGVPVNWSQISNARVIVEVSLENFPLDSSLGSHFFHNVTSMNIGYFSVLNSSKTDYIRWEKLGEGELIEQTTFLRHIRFEQPARVLMNGKQKTAVILINT